MHSEISVNARNSWLDQARSGATERRLDGEPGHALERGYRYLLQAAAARGIETEFSFDAAFTAPGSLAEMRRTVADKLGVDIGFDATGELFSSMVCVKLLSPIAHHDARSLTRMVAPRFEHRHWRRRHRMFDAQGPFAADTDCTGMALAGLYECGFIDGEELTRGAAELLRSAAPKGSSLEADDALFAGAVMVYWDDDEEPSVARRGRKSDPVAACNALYALKLAETEGLLDPGGVIARSLDYLGDHLSSGAYLQGTRYYPSPDTFLCFAAQLCGRFPDCRARLGAALHDALHRRNRAPARPGQADDPDAALNLAQRIIAADELGVDLGQRFQRRRLMKMPSRSGAWAASPFFSLGKLPIYFGSAAITTLFAVAALQPRARGAR